MLKRRLASRMPGNSKHNDQEMTGHRAATLSSDGAAEMTGTRNRRLAIISRSSSATKEGEDGAEAVLTELVGSQVTSPA